MNLARLTQLHAVHLATREPGGRAEGWAAAGTVYRCYAVAIAAGLPFP